eukprot:CAMPEP_0197065548 /NCGR_PEP_ID=MMETSP1384-20130603/167738_1 /TAXON_ID=29189 /ORGANISM="Ammonia sp." /LENGTH=47 /DNA_ID= /DNA_START= /DNA_END= /DNA_ORIENTATION=
MTNKYRSGIDVGDSAPIPMPSTIQLIRTPMFMIHSLAYSSQSVSSYS